MKLLIAIPDKKISKEIQEFFENDNEVQSVIAHKEEKVISLLNKSDFSRIYLGFDLSTNSLLLNYINKNFPGTDVYLLSTPEHYELISSLKNGKYKLIKEDHKLSTLL